MTDGFTQEPPRVRRPAREINKIRGTISNYESDAARRTRARALDLEDIHLHADAESGLQVAIAVHSSRPGPAVGGCHWLYTENLESAAWQAARLARAMSLRAAVSGLAAGGGAAVLVRPRQSVNETAYFSALGDLIEGLGGRFLATTGTGTQVEHMDLIAARTNHVTSTSPALAGVGDTAVYTAFGVERGIRAALQHCYGRTDLGGVHVVIHGLGRVGWRLAERLHAAGARLSVADRQTGLCQRAARDFGARVLSAEAALTESCDVLAPCAPGCSIDADAAAVLGARILAGSADDQLDKLETALLLHQRGIICVPDYLLNAGALIYLALRHSNVPEADIRVQIDAIYDRTLALLAHAEREDLSPTLVAERLALQRLLEPDSTPDA